MSSTAPPPEEPALRRFLETLFRQRKIPLSDCPLPAADLAALGLPVTENSVTLPMPWDPLTPAAIRDALSPRGERWLEVLDVRPVIGSTNTELTTLSAARSIQGIACLAELQVAGRGRRGRTWLSPLGGNLALSLGFAISRPPAELGGLSLVVGLAAVDVLESCGVPGLALKWPNDLLRGGAKLGGILIELVKSEQRSELVIGIGVNVRLPAAARGALDQPVADLASAAAALPSRSALAGRLISGIVEFVTAFEAEGFAPFMAVFDQRHLFQGRQCRIEHGSRTTTGEVLGVTADGGLRLATASGVEVFHGGEVSLRPVP